MGESAGLGSEGPRADLLPTTVSATSLPVTPGGQVRSLPALAFWDGRM